MDTMLIEQAQELARRLRPEDADWGLHYDDLRTLCDYILSGSMKREIENAAFERARKLRTELATANEDHLMIWQEAQEAMDEAIAAIIHPPAQKENGG